ncbi:MAG: YfiM family protein [Thermoanaerobaculia bacterium]|nr:YfiM family protein [Thermoanaerobaculia bacterium]
MVRTISALFLLSVLLVPERQYAQQVPFFSLQPADTLHKPRLWAAVGTGTVIYGATMIGLHRNWVSNETSDHFHTINDFGDWNQMDKMSHWMMSYNESRWLYAGASWAGVRPRTAAWLGFAGGQLIMTSLEMFDGYAAKWGFSWSDMGFNLLGSGLFLAQQLGWKEQRLTMKVSAWPKTYASETIYPVSPAGSDGQTTLQQRSDVLYGMGPLSLFLKNYNTNTVWMSVNPRSFFSEKAAWLPRWLNVAVGMGADNLFVGQGYEWKASLNCEGPGCDVYRLNPERYPRTRQFYLSFDVDLTRLGIRNRFLRTLAGVVNIIKFPAPALEVTDRGGVRFHPVFF